MALAAGAPSMKTGGGRYRDQGGTIPFIRA